MSELKFAGKLPVVINRSNGENDVFSPIRSSSCDITVVSNKILSDLYTNDKKGIVCKVEKINQNETTTLFEGYMTPNTYSQHISPNLDQITMTAIDPLATLKYLYVDSIIQQDKTITIGEFIGGALSMVKVDLKYVFIEDCVRYMGSSTLPFAGLKVQTSNFWDEGDNSMTVYDALSECLRLFGLSIILNDAGYFIYSVITDHTYCNNTLYRYFLRYELKENNLVLTHSPNIPILVDVEDKWFRHNMGDWTTIDDNPTVSIDDTYDRIACVASTKIPEYNKTAFDYVSPENRNLYYATDANIDLNPIKGYSSNGEKKTSDWLYIWNGIYVNSDFNLNIDTTSENFNNGYANINNIFTYVNGLVGLTDVSGSLLQYYGSEENPNPDNTENPKNQLTERSVEVKECITFFAPDNGTVPEFLSRADFTWQYKRNIDTFVTSGRYTDSLSKTSKDNSKYGISKSGLGGNAFSYNQTYDNLVFNKDSNYTFNFDLKHSYSRTGINQPINIHDYSVMENYIIADDDVGNGNYNRVVTSGYAYTIPWTWQANQVKIDNFWFNKYNNSNGKLKEVWDYRYVHLYIELSNGKTYQFNGKDWVLVDAVSNDNAFRLCKLLNGKKLYHEEFTYDIIICSDGEQYSLSEDAFTYYIDKNGAVELNAEGELADEGNTQKSFSYYLKSGNEWRKWIVDCSEGNLSINLPAFDAINVTVKCNVYNSILLGSTNRSSNAGTNNRAFGVYYKDGNTIKNTYTTGSSWGLVVSTDFTPYNVTYIKAEHIELNMSLTMETSNLSQMFGESDIKYQTTHSKIFRQTYDAPNFLVNTKHNLVNNSQSYIIADNGFAQPDSFRLGSLGATIDVRPENYVLQAYKNFYSPIRRVYNRVLVPHKDNFDNFMCYIEVPDLPDNGKGRWFLVTSDSYDVKTNRHTISAIEDYDINVTQVDYNYTVVEIPREARYPRYNLPSVMKIKRSNTKTNTKPTVN